VGLSQRVTEFTKTDLIRSDPRSFATEALTAYCRTLVTKIWIIGIAGEIHRWSKNSEFLPKNPLTNSTSRSIYIQMDTREGKNRAGFH